MSNTSTFPLIFPFTFIPPGKTGNLLISLYNALYLDGLDDYIEFSSPHDFSTNVQGGYSIWFKNKYLPNDANKRIVNPGTARLDLNLEKSTGKLFIWFVDSSAAGHLVWKSTRSYVDEMWHNVIVNKTQTRIEVYVDGELQGYFNTTNVTYDTSSGYIGFDGTQFWNGYVSDFKVFSTSLLQTEINRVYYNKYYVPSSTVLWYNVNAIDGTSLKDSVNSHNPILNGNTTLTTGDSIDCWASRFDIDNYNITIETILSPGDRNDLFKNITPGAVRELYNILGTPYFIDSTYSSGNTINVDPIGNLADIVNSYKIAIKSISDTPIGAGNKLFSVKIEGTRIDLE